ncbi:hypothetical protein [Algoriphagus hitonicola]|uniref:hypothetical protein n=1 Tax=Algoriphagus hitonicola TaxID=435880 RepID=UPI00361B0B1F
MRPFRFLISVLFFVFTGISHAQEVPSQLDTRIYEIIENTSAERIEKDIRTLAGFGTRNTFSDTVSTTGV